VLVSGFVADVVFEARYRILNLVFMVALGGCLLGLFAVGSGSFWLVLLLLAAIGFFVEGPQSILGGVCAVDAGQSARVASSAAGLVGFLSYFGASLSGVGTGFAIDQVGWSGAFTFWIVCVVVGLLVGTFLWKERPSVAS
jgi:MFS transporter, OPA family, sugar phosphate sensor protein UhpC